MHLSNKLVGMATPSVRSPEEAGRKPGAGKRVRDFWQRVTEGMELNQLWSQFRKDAHSSYRMYSQEVDRTRSEGVSRRHHFFGVMGQFFWAIIEKLTPARRVLLLIALVLLFFPGGEWSFNAKTYHITISLFDFHVYGGLLMFVLLILEVGDRVVMKRDLQIAKEIQAWLLPAETPSIAGIEVAFATRPANTVAGDYYDVFARSSGDAPQPTFLLAVADVAGKSIPAAMLMATFQASLKTLSTTPGPLTELVARMNRYACSNSQMGRRFTTAFIAEYDPASRRLNYVNAGHNNPILRRRSGSIERLEAGGMPLGVMENASYDSGERVLEPGDWLAIFTDGVVEAEDLQQQEYGEMRLISILQAGADATPSLLLNKILTDLDRFVGNAPQHDDVTCLLVHAV